VKLRAYSVPVTNRKAKKGSGEGGMRVDWTTIDKVVEWVRSRLHELCLPTERTLVLFKYSIDDPVRSFIPRKMREQ